MPSYKEYLVELSKTAPSITTAAILAGLLCTTQATMADTPSNELEGDPRYVAGVYLGSFGLGASVSVDTDLSLISGDKIQWRTSLSGADIEDASNDDYSDIDYNDIDVSLYALKSGVDWYPYQTGWADEVYFSVGMLYLNSEFQGSADTSKSFSVGGAEVQPGDINSLNTSVEYSGVLPYLSLGWGNKLVGKRGFDFQAEIGLAYRVSDVQVGVTADDPDGVLTAANLSAEAREIEDEMGDIQGFSSITVSYIF